MRELNSICKRELGISPVMGNNPMWIATAAMLAGSALSSIFGGASASKAAKRARRELRYRKNEEKAWYDKEYNTDYLDTKAGQNLMRKAQEVQDKYIKRADGAAAVGGGTDASVAMAKEQANKAMGDTIANVAAQDTARKQHVADQHMSNINNMSQQAQAIEQSKAEATSQAAQNMSNALASAAVSQLGSEPSKTKAPNNNELGKTTTINGDTNVTQSSQNPTIINDDGVPSLDKAVGISHSKVRYL